jgi:hypothetical protein
MKYFLNLKILIKKKSNMNRVRISRNLTMILRKIKIFKSKNSMIIIMKISNLNLIQKSKLIINNIKNIGLIYKTNQIYNLY